MTGVSIVRDDRVSRATRLWLRPITITSAAGAPSLCRSDDHSLLPIACSLAAGSPSQAAEDGIRRPADSHCHSIRLRPLLLSCFLLISRSGPHRPPSSRPRAIYRRYAAGPSLCGRIQPTCAHAASSAGHLRCSKHSCRHLLPSCIAMEVL